MAKLFIVTGAVLLAAGFALLFFPKRRSLANFPATSS